MEDTSSYIDNALELPQSYTNPLGCSLSPQPHPAGLLKGCGQILMSRRPVRNDQFDRDDSVGLPGPPTTINVDGQRRGQSR